MSNERASSAVERALAILEAVSHRSNGMSNSEISRRLAIPKSSASYILRTLEKRGYLRRERGSGKYKIGLRVLGLLHGVQAGLDIREVALPVLRHLVDRTRLTAHLAILDNGEAVYIEKVDAPGFVKMNTWVGRRLDVHSTSVGKVLVAHLQEAELDAVLKERGLRRRTPKTICVRSRFLQELEKVRARGCAVDDEENNIGVRCVAAPVFSTAGKVQAAVGLSGTTAQLDKASLPKALEMVKEAARQISHQYGYRGRGPI